MGTMLANRYLLNGRAAEALQLYRQALNAAPEQSALQCRLILAHLEASRVDEAAGFVLGMLEEFGLTALTRLQTGCQGFVPTDVPEDHDAITGLRALMSGNTTRARQRLGNVAPGDFPAVAALATRLEEIHGS